MAHFTVHDLRRTCRTLLAKQGTLGHVAERCLNHKLKGVEGIYNQHDYFEERKEAITILSEKIHPITKLNIAINTNLILPGPIMARQTLSRYF